MKKKLGILFLVSIVSVILTACSTSKNSNNKLNIVTTFYPVYEFSKEIVGDTADVKLLIGAGTEVHEYEPSAKAIATIQDSDAFIYENENMETWAPKVIDGLDKNKVKVVKATENMLLLPGIAEEEEEHAEGEAHSHEYDPHVWLSPKRAIIMVESIRDQLSTNFPDKKDTFEKNAKQYIEKLEQLDKKYTAELSNAKQKSFVTQHAAFAYLALDYNLKQVPIAGLSPDKEPTAARLAELTKYIKDNSIKYIYFEENASSTVANTLAKETGVKLDVLNPLESLTEQETKNGENYISVMESNLKSLKQTTDKEGSQIKSEKEESTKTVYNGYFNDSEIKDRTLSDYAGNWKSVYPYLLDGTFDQVFDYKSKLTGKMTASEYKNYYTVGYKTDIDRINITDNTMEFIVNGKSQKYTYKYVGKHTLTYKKGNRGVRYLFEAIEENAGKYKYIQFSDHNIAPVKADHFHIFMGSESQEALYNELENWPTFYPDKMNGKEIAQEMLSH